MRLGAGAVPSIYTAASSAHPQQLLVLAPVTAGITRDPPEILLDENVKRAP